MRDGIKFNSTYQISRVALMVCANASSHHPITSPPHHLILASPRAHSPLSRGFCSSSHHRFGCLFCHSRRYELYRDVTCSDSRELPHPPHLLLRPIIFGRRITTRIQIVFTRYRMYRTPHTAHCTRLRSLSVAHFPLFVFVFVFVLVFD